MNGKKRIAVLVSSGGTNLQALIDAQTNGIISHGEIKLVLSSSPDAFALERARNAGIETAIVDHKEINERKPFTEAVINILQGHEIDLVVLAGFMYILDAKMFSAYENCVINVHPALIPSFCGDGFYGLRVHKAALDYGVKLTGATVHFVNGVTDGGPIIAQKAVEIKENDTPQTLQKRVMTEAEWIILPRAVELFCAGKLFVADGKVKISE